MGGGLLQLIAVNDEDQYLIKNPNINFFKKVYMRHSNFTASSFEIPCTTYNKMGENTIDNKLSFNNSTSNALIHPGYRKIVNDLGFKKENHLGNLIIEFDVEFPENLSEEQINKLRDIL